MTIKSKIGLEAEFLLRNTKDDLIVPPSYFDRDDFPLLGEIRGKEGEDTAETVSNFIAREMKIVANLRKGHSVHYAARERCPLALYKKANSQIDWDEKSRSMADIKNIHGIDINEYSDQIISKNKIQGVHVSCGLHIHFSCEETDEVDVEDREYTPVSIPLAHRVVNMEEGVQEGMKEMLSASLDLYRYEGYKKKSTLKARASRLNKPAIHFIVDEMDKAFFDRFAPPKTERTKYRQPGFYEMKPYGFEYRSLPFTAEVYQNLLEITTNAFDLLKEINSL